MTQSKMAAALVAALSIAPLSAAATQPAAAQQIIEYRDADGHFRSWFGLDERALRNWRVSGESNDPNTVAMTRRLSDSAPGLQIAPRHRVLVLYPKPSSAYDVAMSKILNVFHERDLDVEFTAVNFHDEHGRGVRALETAEDGDFDLILSMGSQSTAWLWNNYRNGRIPVVSVTSKDPVMLDQASDYDVGSDANFAFTSLNMPVEAQLAYVLELRPELRNLAILVDSNNVSAIETQADPIRKIALARGIRVITLEVQDNANAAAELRSLVSGAVEAMRKNDVLLENSLFWITGSTAVFREIETINAHADRVPVLSVVPEVVTTGANSAVISIGISFESNAHMAAIYAIRVLEGDANVGELPVGLVSPPDIAVNFMKAREIGLSVPFSFVEGATFIYDYDGQLVRLRGVSLARP